MNDHTHIIIIGQFQICEAARAANISNHGTYSYVDRLCDLHYIHSVIAKQLSAFDNVTLNVDRKL